MLAPLPIIGVLFEQVSMALVGPLPKSARGHEHILAIENYTTYYLEGVLLQKATSKKKKALPRSWFCSFPLWVSLNTSSQTKVCPLHQS